MRKATVFLVFIFAALEFVYGQTPTLGTYPATTITTAGGNGTVTPSATPTNTVSITAYTSTNFKGQLHVNPATGVLMVTDAHPAGTYNVTIKAFNGVTTATGSFVLTVGNTICSQGLFEGTTNITNGNEPYSVAIGDFNNDGKQDFVTSYYGTGNVVTSLGNGSGGFSTGNSIPAQNNPASIAVADFDGDGIEDFAIANYGSNSVSIRLGNGSGGATGTTNISVGTNPVSIVAADFNGDGIKDFATANFTSNNVSIRLGDGVGTFNGTTEISVETNPRSIAIGDFNGDGKQDFATSSLASVFVSIRLGNGLGSFVGGNNVNVGGSSFTIAVGDLNNDGKQDLAAANDNNYSVATCLGDGLGNFSNYSTTGVSGYARGVAIGDFNGDGNQDLATTNYYTAGTISINLGDGTGSFSDFTIVSVGGRPIFVGLGDFNQDGKQDILSANSTGNNVSVRLNNSNAADVNVQGNGFNILDGDVSPSIIDSTDFGAVSGIAIKNFTIQNTGAANLTIKNITMRGSDSLLFAKDAISLPLIIAPASSATFKIRFVPTSAGLKTTAVNVITDDCDESIYDFMIQGNGVAATPPVIGNYPATHIAFASGNSSVTPATLPTNVTKIVAYTTLNFKGHLQVNPVTGVLTVTDAHPAGTYYVTVKAFNGFTTSSTSFFLSVTPNGTGCSQSLFTGTNNVAVGDYPISIGIGDFNNDGNQDFVTANRNSNNVSVRLGNGLGGFIVSTNVGVGSSPFSIVIGDFNNDGKQDFATTNLAEAFTNSVSIRLGDGAGGFSAATNLFIGSSPQSLAIGDFNGDGMQDIAVTSQNPESKVHIRLGDGTGNFNGSFSVSVGGGVQSVVVGDFNNDGKQDFATVNSSRTVSIRLGDGFGGFNGVTEVNVGTNPQSIVLGDLNGDNNIDFVVPNFDDNSISVGIGAGTGNFITTTEMAVGEYPSRVNLGDFNGDGNQDIVVTNLLNSRAITRLGTGTGSFLSPTEVIVAIGANAVAVGDFNNDGLQDLAVANAFSDNISIRLGNVNEINVLNNNISIADGDNTPTISDSTDFGNALIGGSIIHSFKIKNLGAVNLKVTNITLSGGDSTSFTKSGINFPATIAPGDSATFTISFSPLSAGLKTTTIKIINDDCDESTYDFTIQGTGECSDPGNNIWLGNTPDWNLATNWSLGTVPIACSNVIINNGVPFMPEVTEVTSTCFSLTLNNGATVTVRGTGKLNIIGK